jgi:hypothetical protein
MFRTASGLPAATAAIAAAAVIAACGSNSPSTSSASSSGRHTTHAAQVLSSLIGFAHCMRSHGAPSLPDPRTSPRGFKFAISPESAHSPAFQSAETACRQLLPVGRQGSETAAPTPAHTAALLAFARCLRSHGFPRFPDPTSGGQVTHEMLANAGINLHELAVVQAADACVSVTHGVITRADVAQFATGQ